MTNNESYFPITTHSYCMHEATKAGRAACRKARKVEADARTARLDAIIDALSPEGFPMLARVCRRYSDRYTHNHADHTCDRDCADAIANYIDAQARQGYTISEVNLRSHAYRMFS